MSMSALYWTSVQEQYTDYVHDMSDDCIQKVLHSTVLAKQCMLVQLVQASAPQMTSTNWKNISTDARVSITAVRPLQIQTV